MSPDGRQSHAAEVCTAAVLSCSALATAWCGFQATLWNGLQAEHYTEASGLRIESARASAAAGQVLMIDVGMYLNWVDAIAAKDTVRATFLRDRFRPEFHRPFEAWLALLRLDSAAPASPFAMSEYRLEKQKEARLLEERAALVFADGQRANDWSDRYTFVTVLLASSLFLAGIAQQFHRPRVQGVLIVASGMLCLLGFVMLMRLPVEQPLLRSPVPAVSR